MGLMFHQEMMRRVALFTRGWTQQNIERMAADFFDEHVIERLQHNILPIIYDHRKAKHSIFFVTEVMEPLAKQFAKYFQARSFSATVIKDEDGVLTGEIERLCWREEKVEQVRQLAQKNKIKLSKSYAYADADEDIPMMKLVKHKVALNPRSELEYISEREGWHILE